MINKSKQDYSLEDAVFALIEEDNLLCNPVEDYLASMPLTRASAEEIMQTILNYDGCYELWSALWNDEFSQFLTAQEKEKFEKLYKQVFDE